MNSTSSFRESLYADYVSGHGRATQRGRGTRELLTDVVPHLPLDPDAVILDIGCGNGELAALLVSRGYRNVTGIDISPEQVAVAHQLGRPYIEVGDVFEMAFTHTGTYDAVTAVDVIEHFDRDQAQRVFQSFADLLKPGGRLVFRSPNGGSPYVGRYLYGDLTHGVVYTERSLHQVCSVTGFERLTVFPVRPAGTTLPNRLRRTAWRVVEGAIKVPLIVESGVVCGHIVTQNLAGFADKRRRSD